MQLINLSERETGSQEQGTYSEKTDSLSVIKSSQTAFGSLEPLTLYEGTYSLSIRTLDPPQERSFNVVFALGHDIPLLEISTSLTPLVVTTLLERFNSEVMNCLHAGKLTPAHARLPTAYKLHRT